MQVKPLIYIAIRKTEVKEVNIGMRIIQIENDEEKSISPETYLKRYLIGLGFLKQEKNIYAIVWEKFSFAL